jgi:hypothetical protein
MLLLEPFSFVLASLDRHTPGMGQICQFCELTYVIYFVNSQIKKGREISARQIKLLIVFLGVAQIKDSLPKWILALCGMLDGNLYFSKASKNVL